MLSCNTVLDKNKYVKKLLQVLNEKNIVLMRTRETINPMRVSTTNKIICHKRNTSYDDDSQ